MEIYSVKISGSGYIVNGVINVPGASGNRHYQAVQEWIAAGNTPDPEFTLDQLKANHIRLIEEWFANEEAKPVVVDGFNWWGGYDSAMKLDAGRRFGTELGRPTINFVDADGNPHALTKPQADSVVQGVASAYEALYTQKVTLIAQTRGASDATSFPPIPGGS